MQLLNNINQQRAHFPVSANRILNTRSLSNGHQRIVNLLQPGMNVLDIGCGSGSITRGIAKAVGTSGLVVGIDINHDFITEAHNSSTETYNLSFKVGNIYNLPFRNAFDIVIAARILHWLDNPLEAIKNMIKYVKPGGHVLVHDTNLEKVDWKPSPPNSVKTFYKAFLEWRAEVGMDNTIADKIQTMFKQAGLVNIVETPQHEITKYTDPEFGIRIGIWEDVMDIQGYQMVQDGCISESLRMNAKVEYKEWVHSYAEYQSIYFVAVDGTSPI